jgi:cytochrome c556
VQVLRISYLNNFAAFLLFGASAISAQQNAEMTEWMKATAQASDKLRKAEKKTGSDVVSQAERLGGIYEEMIGFWRQQGTGAEDAVKLSVVGKAAAVALASAANRNDEAAAASAIRSLTGTCKSCHDTHREKIGENKYRIKVTEQ